MFRPFYAILDLLFLLLLRFFFVCIFIVGVVFAVMRFKIWQFLQCIMYSCIISISMSAFCITMCVCTITTTATTTNSRCMLYRLMSDFFFTLSLASTVYSSTSSSAAFVIIFSLLPLLLNELVHKYSIIVLLQCSNVSAFPALNIFAYLHLFYTEKNQL